MNKIVTRKRSIALILVVFQMVILLTACGNGLEVDPTKNADEDYIGSTEQNNYKYDVFDTYVKITEYVGNEEVVTVPSTLEDKLVKEIADQAFADKDGRTIKEVILPTTITTMTPYAFNKLTTLEKISFDGDNPNFAYNEGIIYNKDVTKIITYPSRLDKKEYVIPSTVTEISDSQFASLVNLEKITIPNSVTMIGSWAFKNCVKLTSIELPDSIESIGMAAFIGCIELEELTCPNKDIEGLDETGVMSAPLKVINGYPGTNAETLASDLGAEFVSLA